ncbi:hypothetical protein VTO42DRAFT_372 [Malbranchea cinnamomea]
MSLKSGTIWAPCPSTARGRPTQLSSDPKGEQLAYASNKSIFLRSIDNPSISKQYTDHKAETTVARFSPSGYYVASGDAAGTVRVWDCVGEGITKGEYFIVSGRINDLAWDGESQRIIAIGDGKQRFGHCITADSGNSVGEITGHSQSINSVSIRQQRPLRAAAGGDDKTLVFYHGAPFKYNNGFRDIHTNYIYGVAFSPDGSHLASVGADRRIWLSDGRTGEPKTEVGCGEHKGSIFAVSWASDSRKFVTASADRTVKIWDAEYGKVIQSWSMGDEGPAGIPHQQVGVVWPSGRNDGLIISLSLSGDLHYLVEGMEKPTRTIQGHQKSITSIAHDTVNNREILWTSSSDGKICNWDVSHGSASTVKGSGHNAYVCGVAAVENGHTAYSVGWDDFIRQIDTRARCYTGFENKLLSQPKAIAASDDATLVANANGIEFFRNGTRIAQYECQFPVVTAVAQGSVAAIGGENSVVQICKIAPDSLETILTVTLSRNPITALAFSQDSSMLAAGDSRGRIFVLKVADGSIITDRWTAHTARVTALAWSQRGLLASGSLDTSICVWSLAQVGDWLQVPNAHKEGVNAVAWTSDGAQIVSAGTDAAVKTWEVADFD